MDESTDGQVYVGAHAVPGCVLVTLRIDDKCITLSPDSALETARMLASWAGWAQSATTHMQVSEKMTQLVCCDTMGHA